MSKVLRYAGIGSRETPSHVLEGMERIARYLSDKWILRSGFAEGADQAFYRGAKVGSGKMENFIPWWGFNGVLQGSLGFHVPTYTDELLDIAQKYHPAWDRCTIGAKKLHARNVCQILGSHLDTPVDMVICWTPNARRGGGTGQAIRIADGYGIPVFDLADPFSYEMADLLIRNLTS
jgi:hypothetical protein